MEILFEKSSCEIEDCVEAQLCELCLMLLRPRVPRVLMRPHAGGKRPHFEEDEIWSCTTRCEKCADSFSRYGSTRTSGQKRVKEGKSNYYGGP